MQTQKSNSLSSFNKFERKVSDQDVIELQDSIQKVNGQHRPLISLVRTMRMQSILDISSFIQCCSTITRGTNQKQGELNQVFYQDDDFKDANSNFSEKFEDLNETLQEQEFYSQRQSEDIMISDGSFYSFQDRQQSILEFDHTLKNFFVHIDREFSTTCIQSKDQNNLMDITQQNKSQEQVRIEKNNQILSKQHNDKDQNNLSEQSKFDQKEKRGFTNVKGQKSLMLGTSEIHQTPKQEKETVIFVDDSIQLDHKLLQETEQYDPEFKYEGQKKQEQIKVQQESNFGICLGEKHERAGGQIVLNFNRVMEIKRKYKSRVIAKKLNIKRFTFNLTFILSCEISKKKGNFLMLEILLIWGLILRMYFWLFCIYMLIQDFSYLLYIMPMIIFPRVVYITSLWKVIFDYTDKTQSYRQVSQIFNSAFVQGDYFQIMNMNELLTSDSHERLSREKVQARIKFILCPSEFNLITLDFQRISHLKRSQVWYLSNYVLLSIEQIFIYSLMIFITLFNKQFEKQFEFRDQNSINFFTISFLIFISSLIYFLLFSLFYLQKGNLKLRKDNQQIGKT